MGRSSPPFLYGPPSTYSFTGPTDRPFNPKAATQASKSRESPKPKSKRPFINFNKHPDSFSLVQNGKTRWTPMSPKTKGRVFHGRKGQLALRVLALLGALGSLFCAIVVKNVAATIVWIIRVGPCVAILHTLYGIYHLSRSPIGRPTGSQASYMVFAATFDLGLIPFYVFTAFIAYKQYTTDYYHWETLFDNAQITEPIAKVTFILSIANGGLHAISLGLSIFLAVLFREITKLPPDLNPLEDNLTARPHKRNKSEMAEKHLSQSTMDTAISSDPLIGSPRAVPFMHTRERSSVDGSARYSDQFNEQRQSQGSHNPDYLPYEEPPVPEIPAHLFQADHFLPQTPVQEMENIKIQTPSNMSRNTPIREPSPSIPDRSQCVSPESDNWIVYPSRSPSPIEEFQATQNENLARRDPSSVYDRTVTPASTNSGGRDWLGSAQRYGWGVGGPIAEDVHGEYESLAAHEYYGNDDDIHDFPLHNRLYDQIEQDLGENRINIFHDYDDHEEDHHNSLPFNPLGLNPPTPQPPTPQPNEPLDNISATGRNILADIPNLSPTPPVAVPEIDSPEKKGRFYGELEGNPGLSVPRGVSGQDKPYIDGLGRKPTKLVKRKSQKMNSYGPLRQNDADSDADENSTPPLPKPVTVDGDRKGRVVSNSGADYGARHNTGPGAALSSYGSYIAGLGVGRRRDVSGKVAEEGRSGATMPQDKQPQTTPVRAAGWARFAGL
ncbi:hypothetical protein ASPWEDRAFT_175672 [Aspergillus wentii DTO 134E9]|uniref:Uncharacterized protein n=1 Tax=Aspergillus wentii DTO 134E9 TaxID=1073089 RepID=A0A1L9RBU7_ASPWE|nr:uncharacterized protein ASPWEDRAFT_175672 [Aspergillus wentii DTO 134E9]KAI9934952.1 hypothetical protein MW887_000573 [Aspergillus wentii]OJJ32394.1 hypothetical protein ASPWEDRAFT_175672 [Aspergillus wentii DTO 134E9]